MSSIINMSICVSDIPKDLIKVAANGKKYLSVAVCEKKEVDQYGKTHYMQINKTADEKARDGTKIYIGSGTVKHFGETATVQAPPPAQTPPQVYDDLPF